VKDSRFNSILRNPVPGGPPVACPPGAFQNRAAGSLANQ
jgi:hypothetical protein